MFRTIASSYVKVDLYRYDELIASLEFDHDFIETERYDPDGHIKTHFSDDWRHLLFFEGANRLAYAGGCTDDFITLLLVELFMFEPAGDYTYSQRQMWNKMHRIDLDQLVYWWDRVDNEKDSMIDPSVIEYTYWTAESGNTYEGGRRRNTMTEGYGPLRAEIRSDENDAMLIHEFSRKNDENHGLYRVIAPTYVEVLLYQDGALRAEFRFDHDFVELERDDPSNYFTDKGTPQEWWGDLEE